MIEISALDVDERWAEGLKGKPAQGKTEQIDLMITFRSEIESLAADTECTH